MSGNPEMSGNLRNEWQKYTAKFSFNMVSNVWFQINNTIVFSILQTIFVSTLLQMCALLTKNEMLSSTTTKSIINNKLLIHFTITSMTTREITRLISNAMELGFETVEQIKSDMTHIHSIHHGHIIGKIEIQSRIKIQEIKMKQTNELTSNNRILISRLEKNVEMCNEIKSEENTDELFLDHFTRYLHHQRSREQEQQREERQSKKNRNIVHCDR